MHDIFLHDLQLQLYCNRDADRCLQEKTLSTQVQYRFVCQTAWLKNKISILKRVEECMTHTVSPSYHGALGVKNKFAI